MPEYPWFELVEGDSLEQGDILEGFRVYSFSGQITAAVDRPVFDWIERDVIVMTQSCDLVREQRKVNEMLLCSLWRRSEAPEFQRGGFMEAIRCGRQHRYHLLAECAIADHEREFRIVDFSRVTVLPVDFVRQWLSQAGPRLRLLPPYREHLSQAFARFFMRVGLPADIPPFKQK